MDTEDPVILHFSCKRSKGGGESTKKDFGHNNGNRLAHKIKNDFNVVVYQQKIYAKCGFRICVNSV